jgi:hypothetical protein
METQQSGIKWSTVVIAGAVMFIIALVITQLVPTAYGFYVGFSTRGDMVKVNEALMALGTSMPYRIFMYAIFAAVGLWRGYVLAKTISTQVYMQIGVAVLVAAVLLLTFYFVMSGGAITAIMEGLIFALLLAGGAFLSTLLKPKPAQA